MPAPRKVSSDFNSALEYSLVWGMENLTSWQSVRYENVPLYKLKSVSLNKIRAEEKSVDN